MKHIRQGLLYVAMLVARCANAANRREQEAMRFESPRAALACVLSALLLGVSCASGLTGVTENITVDSTPQGANATLSCKVGPVADSLTPAKFTIARNAGDCTVEVSKSGYVRQHALIEQGVNPAYWGNVVTAPAVLAGVFLVGSLAAPIGGPLIVAGASGWLVDLRTGAIHAHRPRNVRLTLPRSESE